MFVGYAFDHAGDVYRFINIQSKKIILSRAMQLVNLFRKHYKMRHNNSRRQQAELFLDESGNLSLEGSDPEDNRIDGDGNNTIEQRRLGMEEWIQETCLISAVTSGLTEPKTFQEAWHSPVEKTEKIGEMQLGRKYEA